MKYWAIALIYCVVHLRTFTTLFFTSVLTRHFNVMTELLGLYKRRLVIVDTPSAVHEHVYKQ